MRNNLRVGDIAKNDKLYRLDIIIASPIFVTYNNLESYQLEYLKVQ